MNVICKLLNIERTYVQWTFGTEKKSRLNFDSKTYQRILLAILIGVAHGKGREQQPFKN